MKCNLIIACLAMMLLVSLGRCDPECTTSIDCNEDKACTDTEGKCVDPCASEPKGPCGVKALCTTKNHNPICSCPEDTTGDPFLLCAPLLAKESQCSTSVDCDLEEACLNEEGKCVNPCALEPGPCGTKAICFTRNHVPICSCPEFTTGNPFVECSPSYIE